jgi:antitoxin (DNA-binding transcriptional repressor) of toxin-antitoxin stability system
MKFVSVREFKGKSGQVWEDLAREKDVVLTNNGRPVALVSAIPEGNLEGSLAAVRKARAILAVEEMQRRSLAAGTDRLSPREIEAEIAAVRRGRKR